MLPNPLVVAADVSDVAEAESLAERLAGRVAFIKVGLELFTSVGPDAVGRVRRHAPVFLDLKLHDIPNTVERAAGAAARLGVDLLTVHGLGGPAMVEAAVRGAATGARAAGTDPPRVIAVTVLSSHTGEGLPAPVSIAVQAIGAGAAGVVVSGEDVTAVRRAIGQDPLVVVPGIRTVGEGTDDQVRVLTPAEALRRGADLIVVGRPVSRAADPVFAVTAILRAVGAA